MRRPVQTLLLALTGAGLLHAALFTDIYLRYVKAGLRPPLIASGAVLLLLALAQAAGRDRHRLSGDPGHEHGHDHTGTPRVAWVLFLPALSLLLYAPPALGAYTAPARAASPSPRRRRGSPRCPRPRRCR